MNHIFPKTKAQTATEYLIILAVVIIIALIAVGVLGLFPSIGGGASSSALSAYWQSNGQIGVSSVAVSASANSNDSVVLRNLQPNTITITGVTIRPTTNTSATTIPISGGSQTLASGASLVLKAPTTTSLSDFFPCVATSKFTAVLTVNYTVVSTDARFTFTGDGNNLEGICAN
jgi:uncharacterized protein (UPF0333 family)